MTIEQQFDQWFDTTFPVTEHTIVPTRIAIRHLILSGFNQGLRVGLDSAYDSDHLQRVLSHLMVLDETNNKEKAE